MNIVKKTLLALLMATPALLVSVNAVAQADDHIVPDKANGASAADDRYTVGEIRKIDLAQGKLTIRHGDIKNLGMPGMTMNFKVQNPALLGTVQVGDQVQFVVERQTGGLVITELKRATGK